MSDSATFPPEQRIEVLPDLESLSQRALEITVEQMEIAIAARGRFNLVLAGGNTPKSLYEKLAQESLPWEQFEIFWGDERYVPRDHPDSNEGMARQAWLDHVNIPPEHIHPMPTEFPDPNEAATVYHQTLVDVFHRQPSPQFDLTLLGMGPDGHTASLFPHTPALAVGDRWVTVGNKDGQPRLTLTVPAINQSRCVLFLVAGANKQNALTQVLTGSGDPDTYPARLIYPQDSLIWLLDHEAGLGWSETDDSGTGVSVP